MSAVPARPYRPSPARHSVSAAHVAPQRDRPPSRDHLRAVAMPAHQRSLAPFVWLCLTIIIASLATVLIINTTMTSGAYERRDMRIELADLHQQRAALVTQLEANSAPQHLATTAAELGMVPASTLGFVSLDTQMVTESAGDNS